MQTKRAETTRGVEEERRKLVNKDVLLANYGGDEDPHKKNDGPASNHATFLPTNGVLSSMDGARASDSVSDSRGVKENQRGYSRRTVLTLQWTSLARPWFSTALLWEESKLGEPCARK